MRVVKTLDENKWREFVLSNPRGNIFHSPEMFHVMEQTKDFAPALWAVVDDRETVQALLVAANVTVIGGVFRFLTTRAVVYGGAICSSGEQGREALCLLLGEYRKKVGWEILFTELRNVHDMTDVQPVLEKQGFVYEDHLNYLIDLTQPLEQLWKNIRSNAQRNIRKAEKSGVTVTEAQTLEDVKTAYAVLQKVYERIQVPIPDFSLFESAFALLHPAGMMEILFAKHEGVSIGALTLLLYKGNILYWYTGPLREYAEYRPGDLLVWKALEFGRARGCHTFDFGGGGKPAEKYGVRDFKVKFGGQQVNYGRNICIHAPLRLEISKLGYRLLRRTLS